MNHLGDTNKMVDTPRTDEAEVWHEEASHYHVVGSFLARQLERELNAASKERDDALMMLGMYRMKSDEQKQRIKRLEEAGDKIVESGWSVQDWSGMCVVWAKAKEDKP